MPSDVSTNVPSRITLDESAGTNLASLSSLQSTTVTQIASSKTSTNAVLQPSRPCRYTSIKSYPLYHLAVEPAVFAAAIEVSTLHGPAGTQVPSFCSVNPPTPPRNPSPSRACRWNRDSLASIATEAPILSLRGRTISSPLATRSPNPRHGRSADVSPLWPGLRARWPIAPLIRGTRATRRPTRHFLLPPRTLKGAAMDPHPARGRASPTPTAQDLRRRGLSAWSSGS